MFCPLILTTISIPNGRFIFRILGLSGPSSDLWGSLSIPGFVLLPEGPHTKVCAQGNHTSELHPHSRPTGLVSGVPPEAPSVLLGDWTQEEVLKVGSGVLGKGFW